MENNFGNFGKGKPTHARLLKCSASGDMAMMVIFFSFSQNDQKNQNSEKSEKWKDEEVEKEEELDDERGGKGNRHNSAWLSLSF